MKEEAKIARVAICEECNAVVMISTLPVDKEMNRDFGKAMRDGMTIRQMPDVEWRKLGFGHTKCKFARKEKPQ